MAYRESIKRGSLPHWFVPGAVHFVTYRLADTLPVDVISRLRAARDRKQHQSGSTRRRAIAHKQFFAAFDRYLDRLCTKDWLTRQDVPEVLIENLLHHHESKYRLLEFTIMPNHVHVLLLPLDRDSSDEHPRAGSPDHVAKAASLEQFDVANVASLEENQTYKAASLVSSDAYGDFFSDEIEDSKSPLSDIMHSLKSYTANRINRLLKRTGRLWQPESYDHWVRDASELQRIAEYIALNPVKAGLASREDVWPYGSCYLRKHSPQLLPEWW